MVTVNTNEYRDIHSWLGKNYGKAKYCGNPNCKGISNTYDWALIHEFEYAKDVTHFMQLCRSCHVKYDMTDEIRKNMSGPKSETHKQNMRKPKTKEHRNNISIATKKSWKRRKDNDNKI